MWQRLRSRQLGGYKFRRQHPVGNYIVDFYCAGAQLVVELDGESHIGNEQHDAAREQYLETCGLTVLRFWDTEVFGNTEGVLQRILETCQARAEG